MKKETFIKKTLKTIEVFGEAALLYSANEELRQFEEVKTEKEIRDIMNMKNNIFFMSHPHFGKHGMENYRKYKAEYNKYNIKHSSD